MSIHRMSGRPSAKRKFLYRAWITLVLPIIPLWLLVGLMVEAAPEYWDELKSFYRMYPGAFRKGEPP
jgi:hypothetical protein